MSHGRVGSTRLTLPGLDHKTTLAAIEIFTGGKNGLRKTSLEASITIQGREDVSFFLFSPQLFIV